jgi:hypothetical protein
MILAGTTADKMRGVYSRPDRNSIYEPATIHDLPFEVLKDSFLCLTNWSCSDFASSSLVCRAFRAVALELMHSRKEFIYEVKIELYSKIRNFCVEKFIAQYESKSSFLPV